MALRHVRRQLQRSEIYLGRDAIAKLEQEKKPILQRRDEAKHSAGVCERELAGVEARLQANDSADRELLKQFSALQAQAPPPPDLDARTAALARKRTRLPLERAEIVRAREGCAEACRQATQRLAVAEDELSAAERNIARVREGFEATDRGLNDKARGQQETLRQAKDQHQTVEERKDPAYLNIGRHLATRGIAPPNAPHLLHDVLRHRQSVQRHNEHREQLSVLSAQIDKQELRKFYFVIVSILVLLAIVLPLVLQSPPKREWLPRETDAILSLNAERFDRDDLPKKWRNEDFWLQTWPGLIGAASQIQRLRIPGDAARVTRALTTVENSPPREFLLVEARDNVSTVVRTIAEDKQFERRTISGLPVWQRSDFSIARVGPKTLAVGPPDGVDELVRVRLGLEADLQITGEFFDRYQALDPETTLRLISRDPPGLARAFHPIFPRELLESAQLLGLGVSLQTPVKARLLLRLPSENAASDLAKSIHDDPHRWLRIEQSDLPLFAAPPEINRQHADLEIRFNIPENSARLLLQRIAKTDAPPAATAAN